MTSLELAEDKELPGHDGWQACDHFALNQLLSVLCVLNFRNRLPEEDICALLSKVTRIDSCPWNVCGDDLIKCYLDKRQSADFFAYAQALPAILSK